MTTHAGANGALGNNGYGDLAAAPIDETATTLRRSPHTVKWLRANRLYPKLGARNIPPAVAIAMRLGLIE